MEKLYYELENRKRLAKEESLNFIKTIVMHTDKDSVNHIRYKVSNDSPFGNFNNGVSVVNAVLCNEHMDNKNNGVLCFDDVAKLIYDNATEIELPIKRTLPKDVSKIDHYRSICELSSMLATQNMYDVTKRFDWNYMIVSANILPVLSFSDKFKHCSPSQIYGGHIAGEFNGKVVFVSPSIDEDIIIFGVNDKMTSFAIYYEKDDEYEFRVINPELAVVMKLEK